MKHFLFFMISCLFIISQGTQAQTTISEIIYKKKPIPRFSKDTLQETAATDLIKQANARMTTLAYSLLFTNTTAYFKKKATLPEHKEIMISTLSTYLGGGHDNVYMNKNEDTLIIQKKMNNENYLISSKLSDQVWTLTTEKRKIKGYTCYKAVQTVHKQKIKGMLSSQIIAWYTPEIAVPFGILGYGGLPGLILGLDNEGYRFYATQIQLKTVKKQLPILEDGISMDTTSYQAMQFNNFKKYTN